jgi:hypothetical protein
MTWRHNLKIWWSKSKNSARFEAANPAFFGDKLHAAWPTGQPHVTVDFTHMKFKFWLGNKTAIIKSATCSLGYQFKFFHWSQYLFSFFPRHNSPQWARAFIEASRSHSDMSQSVRLLWMSDRPVAETSTWQNTFTRDRHLCSWRDSNQQSQQASGRRPTPQATIRPN